jgi:hypothetical protein
MKDFSDEIGYIGFFLCIVIMAVLGINYFCGDFLNIL